MAYGDNRNQLASDDFSTDPFSSRWANGPGDFTNMSWDSTNQRVFVGSGGGGARNVQESYPPDQYSSVTLFNNRFANQWVGPVVRMDPSGSSNAAYIGYIAGDSAFEIW